jgi:hypothetical protein
VTEDKTSNRSYLTTQIYNFRTDSPSIPEWATISFLGIYGFAIALSVFLVMADPAGKAPRPIISGPPKTWQILDTEPPAVAESQMTQRKLAQLEARTLKSGTRTLSLPCNEEFRQAFLKDARAFLAARSTTGSFGMATGRMGGLRFDQPDDALEAIETAVSTRHVSRGELAVGGDMQMTFEILAINPKHPIASGVPLGRAATGEAAGRYTPLCMAGRR